MKNFSHFKYFIASLLLLSLSSLAFAMPQGISPDTPFSLPPIEAFIAKWRASGGSELGSSQSFLKELCALLQVDSPDSPKPYADDNTYTFEKQIAIVKADGRNSTGRIDLYKEGCFIAESKQGADSRAHIPEWHKSGAYRSGTAIRGTAKFDAAMVAAFGQAQEYAEGVSLAKGYPPFIMVLDVGRVIEVYADFTNTGNYTPFPSSRDYRIYLEDLRKTEVLDRLRGIWTDPLSLDPSKERERVTTEVAVKLNELAQSLIGAGNDSDIVSMFLMRAIFSMFAKDVTLLPHGSFSRLLASLQETPEQAQPVLAELWQTMKTGGHTTALNTDLPRFGGHLFEHPVAVPMNKEQIALLAQAAQYNWASVDTSIFGTLIEQALSRKERSKLGAYYTPPAYVERLVIQTVIKPLREEWRETKESALQHVYAGNHESAIASIKSFHETLSRVKILDPACGSGNFLAVSFYLLKDLEGEVLSALHDLGQTGLDFKHAGFDVTPQQFLGIELHPHAAAIAELVLSLTYLQQHYRIHGQIPPTEPILRETYSVQCRDAILAWDAIVPATNPDGTPLMRWDGETKKVHPKTGKLVPDETALVQDVTYINFRKADAWPHADFIVGNPPYCGHQKMRRVLGNAYTEAIRNIYDVPGTADYVMFWVDRAAEMVRDGKAKALGLITTDKISQFGSRNVLDKYLDNKNKPLSITFAIPHHPWDSRIRAASVDVAMIVMEPGDKPGTLATVVKNEQRDGYRDVRLSSAGGKINSDLTIGPDFRNARPLQANLGVAGNGVSLSGKGFIVTKEQAKSLGLGTIKGLEKHIRPYFNGRDLAGTSRSLMVIDLYGLSEQEVKTSYPEVYQWVLERVKPEREQNRRKSYKNHWWFFGEARPELRAMLNGLKRYISTVVTTAHRYFVFQDTTALPDSALLNIALDDAFYLGVLSSRAHILWINANGSRMGKAPKYNKTTCFDTFPFPDATPEQKEKIRTIAEQLDSHRKHMLVTHQGLTLSTMYGAIKTQSNPHTDFATLKKLHDDLDAAVLEAYGWAKDTPDNKILENLLELNQKRHKEEKSGVIHWLRPEFQNPKHWKQDSIEAPAPTPTYEITKKSASGEIRGFGVPVYTNASCTVTIRSKSHYITRFQSAASNALSCGLKIDQTRL